MKTIPAALQAHYDTGSTSMAYGIVIRRDDGDIYGFTSHHESFAMNCEEWGFDASELVFDASQGLNASTIVTTAGFNVDNLELVTLNDGSLFDIDDVRAGFWKSAYFLIFRYRHDIENPQTDEDCEVMMAGWFGDISMNETIIKIELRGITQKLQQNVGIVSSKTCRARLGSTTGASKCLKDLTAFTHSLTVTSVTDRRTFACTLDGSDYPSDYFGEGLAVWLTGNNAGLTSKIRTFAAGVFTLVLPVTFTIQVGDTFTGIAGCRKRLEEDCRDKFDNVLNFQGEPHRPTIDEIVT